MVRNVGRTKGCQTCRTRKIKCDENFPTCTQCARSGHPCPGPIMGHVFLHANPIVKQKTVVGLRKAQRVTAKPKHKNLPIILYTPDTDVFSQKQLMSKLLYFWAAGGSSWASRIFQMSEMVDVQPAWYSSLLGAAILYSKEALGRDLCQVKYRQHYLEGLRYQSTQVQQLLTTTAPPAIEDVLHTMVLLYIEGMYETSQEAILHHSAAAALMLDRIGPENCKNGLLGGLFRDFRIVDAFQSLVTWKPSILASHRWITIPFEDDNVKTSYDLLIDFLLLLPGADDAVSGSPERGLHHQPPFELLRKKLWNMWAVIETEHPSLNLNVNLTTPLACLNPNNNPPPPKQQISLLSSPATTIYYPTPSAFIVVVLYHFAGVLICAKFGTPSSSSAESLLVMHADIVLRSTHNQKIIRQGTLSVYTTVALKAVSVLSPSARQRQVAQYIMRDWEAATGLTAVRSSSHLFAV